MEGSGKRILFYSVASRWRVWGKVTLSAVESSHSWPRVGSRKTAIQITCSIGEEQRRQVIRVRL